MEIKIVVEGQEKEYSVISKGPISFVKVMEELGLNFYRPCGGIGKCNRCAIRFVYGAPEITSEDDRGLDFSDIRNGYRIGCQAIIDKDCKIQVPNSLVGEIKSPELFIKNLKPVDDDAAQKKIVVIDIGTTTIGIALVDEETGDVVSTASTTNSQINFGADVMSRIRAAIGGEADKLTSAVRGDMLIAAAKLHGNLSAVDTIVLSANTTMTHLVLGYPLDGMADYPFVPYSLEEKHFVEGGRNIYVAPGISAFIGGDIVAGIYALDMLGKKETSLLIDLGTNAELVLCDKDRLYCASAAAGPALEGGNISCGVPSIAGAINHVELEKNLVKNLETIDNKSPIGICGSGVIDVVYELLKNQIIDNGGLLIDEYVEKGFYLTENVFITGEDIQQVLLAKSAIRSAIDILVKEAKISLSDIKKVYVAGGLGASVRAEALAQIGLLPKELLNCYEAVGNTSLKGGIKFAFEKDLAAVKEIQSKAIVVELAGKPEFEKKFLENLYL